jgi:hypothetical protein
MKRVIIIFVITIILVIVAVFVFHRYPEYVPFSNPATITPYAVMREAVLTPIIIPTLEPTTAAFRNIPLPESIPTLDVVKDIIISDTPATLILYNDWSSEITLDFNGLEIKISPGMAETRQFPPGQYDYTASTSDCGSPQPSKFTLEAYISYSIHFYCSSTGVFGEQQGVNDAHFVVFNNSSITLTLSLAGRSYQVPPGKMDIRLSPGLYTYSASAPGVMGTAPKTVSLTPGQQFTVSYTITSH